MATDLTARLQQIRDKIQNADYVLSGEQKKAEIAAILAGLTRDEIESLAKDAFAIRNEAVTPLQKGNMMEIPGHILTYPGVDGETTETPNDDDKIDVDNIPDVERKPLDPNKDPENMENSGFKPDFKKNPFKGKKANIQTRGQEIKTDSLDYKKEYPGDGKLQSPMDTARDILRNKKGLRPQHKKIIENMIAQGANTEAISRFIEGEIIQERIQTDNNADKRHFDTLVNQCLNAIPKYLKDICGPDVQSKLNELPDPKRIHIVSEYDFLSISGDGCGVFRSENGDIYISEPWVAQFENSPAIGVIQSPTETITFPRILREIKHILVHELIHGMSVINYAESNNVIGGRRIGLIHVNYNNAEYKGYGATEGTTENITNNILERLYKDEGLLNYKAPWIAYTKEQKILEALVAAQDVDIKWLDFYKGILLRKYEAGKEIERVTPLWELIKKMNGGDTLLASPRPYFYQIIMGLLDYVNQKNTSNIDFIIDFIKNKDISILKNKLGVTLDIVFNKLLLNDNKNNFNELIIKAYSKTV